MAGFDYDAVIVGSGFGGSVAALRAAEKGYRVGVIASGRRWKGGLNVYHRQEVGGSIRIRLHRSGPGGQ